MAVHDLGDLAVEMTRKEYARYRAVSVAAVDNAVYTGRITLLPGGLIDPQVADREWAENTGPQRGIPKPRGSESEGNGSQGIGGQGASLTQLRAQHEQLKLEMTQAELDEKRGNMVPKDVVARTLEEEGQRVRDAVLQVPVQLGAALAACGNPQECIRLQVEALRAALVACAVRCGGDEVAHGA